MNIIKSVIASIFLTLLFMVNQASAAGHQISGEAAQPLSPMLLNTSATRVKWPVIPGNTDIQASLEAAVEAVRQDTETLLSLGETADFPNGKMFQKRFYLSKDADIEVLNRILANRRIALVIKPRFPTPVFYQHDISAVFGGGTATGGLLLDEYGQVDPLEFVALPSDMLVIDKVVLDGENPVAQVRTRKYTATEGKEGLFVDLRMAPVYQVGYGFVQLEEDLAIFKKVEAIRFPEKSQLIAQLESLEGIPYVWGGNTPKGVPGLARLYAPKMRISPEFRKKWTLAGLDCSGLLYYVTKGNTPRNTSSLVSYGTGVEISGLSTDQILAKLKPLDLIAWKGHTLIVLDSERVIESAHADGKVMIKNLKTRLDEIMQKRTPVDTIDALLPEGGKPFVIRRWYPEDSATAQ